MALRRAVWRDRAPWVVAAQLLDRVGIDHLCPMPRVTGILLSNRPDRIEGSIRSIARQRYPNFELFVGCHGIGSESAARAIDDVADDLSVEVVAYPGELSLGACLNDAIDRARGDVLAKIDDDDHYGPAYIEDAVHAMAYSGAELVSKGAVYTYLESADTTYLRKPSVTERFHSGSPNGASMVFTRSLWRRIGFPDRTIGEDVALSDAARSLGVLPYATSPWEFVYRRSVSGNTWDAVDEVFTEGSVVAWAGDTPERCEVPEL
jgi:glycosyltransferase involved in cell wall biosynthesis